MNVERNLQEWSIPNIPIKQIFKQSIFSNLLFLSDYTIKTVEKNHIFE
jgi:hypothetical protein